MAVNNRADALTLFALDGFIPFLLKEIECSPLDDKGGLDTSELFVDLFDTVLRDMPQMTSTSSR